MPPASPARISLPDRYRVVGHLASGGMAAVWEAHDELLDRDVAVKILAPHLGEDERARRRFQREARAAAGLSSHPHVVTIYDVGEHANRVFMVMEIMRGGSLGDRLKSGRAISTSSVVRWMREAAEALDTAEDAGVVHRDIKPANLLLDSHDRLAVADFGIARLAWEDQLTLTGQVLGTAAYISPEQAMGEPASAASDRYSLAVVAYELLTGSRPFEGSHFAAQARAHVEDPPPPPSSREPSLSIGVDAVMAKALAKEPADRYASSAEFASALERALSDDPTAKTRRLGGRFLRGGADDRGRRGGELAGGAAGAALGGALGAAGHGAGENVDDVTGERGAGAGDPDEVGAAGAGAGDLGGIAGPGDRRGGAGAAERWGWGEHATRPRRAGGAVVPPARDGRAAATGGHRHRGSGALLAAVATLVVLAIVGAVALATRGNGHDQRAQTPAKTPHATATPHHTATPKKKATATATPTATASPASTATPTPTATPANAAPSGSPDLAKASALQVQGYNARRAGDFATALAKARAALAACGGAHQLSPCGYALYEEGVALNRSGDPQDAIPILQQRLAQYGDDSSGSVSKELKDAQKRAGGKGGPKNKGPKGNGGD